MFREGFDAPKTRAIIVARPVFSPNAYFQMIGRGLRGVEMAAMIVASFSMSTTTLRILTANLRSLKWIGCGIKAVRLDNSQTSSPHHPPATFSAIMIVVAFVFARITSGITDASTTIRSSTAYISQRGETTAIESDAGPILHVPEE